MSSENQAKRCAISFIANIAGYLKTDIWNCRLESLSGPRSFFVRQLRIVVLAVRGFDEDRCSLKSSALTFYTLLSIVPVAAMLFGIAKGFGFETLLEQQLLARFPGQEEILRQIIGFAHSMLENTRGGLIAGIGIALLFWSVIKLLSNIERACNDIWGIQKGRSIKRKFSDYLSAMLICPLLFIMASSLTVVITSQVKLIVDKLALLQMIGPLIFVGLKVLPYGVIWILFTFLYVFMPNTRVKVRSGLLAGIVAGTGYQVLQWAYISFQIGVAKFNAIYGGFAALPMFLVWLELSWLIVLLGVEISFAHQNAHTYEFEPDCLDVSNAFRRLLALRIVHLVIKAFQAGEQPQTTVGIIDQLRLPIRLAQRILDELVAADVLHEVRCADDPAAGYQPARSIDAITIVYVLDALDQRGGSAVPVTDSPELDSLSQRLDSFGR
ncbi:YihY/virulence factor BrkB family protein, partial [Thermodesulfobacteriota bacterium]